MAEINDSFKKQSERAAAEMFNMRARSMPPVPPFVRTGCSPPREGRRDSELGGGGSEPNIPSPPSMPQKKKKGLLSGDLLKFLDLKNFDLDSDRMLILLLAALLSGENSDEILLFALAYIML